MYRVLLILLLLSTSASAGKIAGVEIPSMVQPDGMTEPLVLNGAGIRSKFFFKIYVAALYLPTRSTESEAILSKDVPNRITMHFVYSEIDRKKLTDGWSEGFKENTDQNQMAEIEDRLQVFNAMFDTLREGDEVVFDYRPGAGTQVTIKGEAKGSIPGYDFNQALLRVWLGPEPVTSDLKRALLGGG